MQSKSVYWTTLDSHPIQITLATSKPGTGIKYEEEGNVDNDTSDNDNTVNNQFDDNIDSPSLSQSSQTSPVNPRVYNNINYEVCEKKFCFGLPADCVKYRGCVMLLSGGFINYFSDGIVEFEVQADAKSSDSNGYYSVGLSSDNKMGN